MHRTFVPDMPSMSGIPIAWKNLTSSEQTGAWFNVLLRSIVARLANLDAFDVARTLSVALVAWWLLSTVSMYVQKPNAPVVGWSYRWEPRFVANFRFFFWPKALLTQGYAKFNNAPFWFARNDADMIVLPQRYVEELRALPFGVANPTAAHAHNLVGHVTSMNLILKSNLHFRVIQSKLTPSLGLLTGPLQEELQFAFERDFPGCKDWTVIRPYHTILRLVARMSGRAFVGPKHCKNEKWLEITVQFTENVFISLLALRSVPTWLHRPLALILPTIWKNKYYVSQGRRILSDDIMHYQKMQRMQEPIKEHTLLSGLVETATPEDNDPDYLAHLAVVISLASIHTTQMNAVHCLNDLAAHPEYIEPIRAEIREACKDGWRKSNITKLHKLDSFIKESQRFNPPSLLSYHRLMQKSHTLSDGMHLPKNAHICVPVWHILNDCKVTPDADKFDGFRYARMREVPEEAHMHQFVTATSNSLNFGYGKYACPGRFFASLEIKSILARLLMNYEFKFHEGASRPKNLSAYEFEFPDPKCELLFRQRPKHEQLDFD